MKVVHVLPFELFLGGGERFIDNWLRHTKHDAILLAKKPRQFVGSIYNIDSCVYYEDYNQLLQMLTPLRTDTVVWHSFPEGPVGKLTGIKKLYWYVHGAYAFSRNISQLYKPRMVMSNYRPLVTDQSWKGTFIASVNLGVDLGQFKLKAKAESDVITIGIVGRISPEKIPMSWFDTLKIWSAKLGTKYRFKFYGAGDKSNDVYKQFMQRIPQFKNFEYCGAMSRDEVAKVYSEFDALIVPSITETGSYTIVEAQACGLKVFALNVDGIPAHVTKHAALCRDYNDMFDKLCNTDWTRMDEIRHEIRNEALQRFDVKEQVQKLDILLTV